MTLAEFDNEVSRIADTSGKPIDAAVVRRVVACAFDVLRELDVIEAASVVSRGLARAGERVRRRACKPATPSRKK